MLLLALGCDFSLREPPERERSLKENGPAKEVAFASKSGMKGTFLKCHRG